MKKVSLTINDYVIEAERVDDKEGGFYKIESEVFETLVGRMVLASSGDKGGTGSFEWG